MENRIKQIDNDLGELIGFSLEINKEWNSVLQVISYPGFKSKTKINNEDVIYSNIASDYYGCWSLLNRQPEEFQIFPIIKSTDIERFKSTGLGYREYWLNYVRRIIESNSHKILPNGNWKMIFSESNNKDWKYLNNKAVPKNNLKGHQQVNEVFKSENPNYSDFEMANIPIPIKHTPFEETGRIKFWKKKIKENSLPPIILLHLSQLSNSIIIDGHSRLLASIIENIPPNLIILYPIVEQQVKPNLEQADNRANALMKQFEKNPKLKLEHMNQLLISFYDDRPWLVRRTSAKFNKDEEKWNNEVRELIERLNLKDQIANIENKINEKTGYNKG